MTNISPLPREAITDPELHALIDEAQSLGVPDSLFPRIVARAKDQAVPLMRALLMSHAHGNVDHKLKEIMRILLARFAGDQYFANLRSAKAQGMGLTEQRINEGCFAYEDDTKGFTEAEKYALRYADLMFLDARQLDKKFYDEMKKHWSEAQIMELGAFVAFHYGMDMFMRSLGATPVTTSERSRTPE
jgi:alkylhydroperoxidase family enzyme